MPTAYRRADEIQESIVGDRVVLHDRLTETSVVLNPTGTRIWLAFEGSRTPEELSSSLLDLYPALTPEQASADVSGFIDQLVGHRYLLPITSGHG
jgi:hypothetical protein